VNFRKLYRIACVSFLIMFFQGNALAATIHGTVYEWNSFKTLNNTVVEVNSTPEQYFVATDANYSFNLTPGTYLITAYYLEGKTAVYLAKEEVVISDKGEYVHDLLMFPNNNGEELLNQSGFEGADLNFDETKPVSQASSQNYFFVSVFLAVIILLLLTGYFIKERRKKPPEIIASFPGGNDFPGGNGELKALQPGSNINEAEFSEEIEDDSAEGLDETYEISSKLPSDITFEAGDLQEDREITLPEDLNELLNLIRNNGNRITQRELRKKSPYSESKVSLMLSDLEERGLIEKFKRGRGNIIRIPDEHVPKQTEDESKQE
jgi:uncharacterized membrane protein